MRAKHVETIVAIAEAGSLGAAAKKLRRSQPALTKALKAIKTEIGCKVFHRNAHGVIATFEGQRIVERCARITADLAMLDEDVAQIRGEFRGSLSVIVSPLVAVKIMPSVLRRYAIRYPGVQVEVSGGHDAKAFKALKDHKVDFVIGPALENELPSGLNSISLLSTGIFIVTRHGSKYANEKNPETLQKAPWGLIGPRDRWPMYSLYFQKHDLVPPIPSVCSDSVLTILSLLENSDMLCSFPSLLFEDVQERWKIKTLDLDIEFPELSINLMSDQTRLPTPAAIAFADLVREEAEKVRLLHN